MMSPSSAVDETIRDAEQVEAEAELRALKPASLRPNDEQLVAHLTTGNMSITDQVSVCAQLGFSTTAKDHGHVGGLLAGKIGSNKFVADYAVDSRAKCRDTKCNAYILQSDLRIGKIPPSIKTGHSCRTHWYHLPCIFRSFRRACKGTKTITSVNDISNFDQLRPSDQQHIRVCIQCAKSTRDRSSAPVGLPYYKPMETVVSEESLSLRAGGDSPTPDSPVKSDAESVGPASRKRKGSPRNKPPPSKKGTIKDMSVSEHEVAGILGLTMLSQPEDGEGIDGNAGGADGDKANTVGTDSPPATTAREKSGDATISTAAPRPPAVVEDANKVGEEKAPLPGPTRDGAQQNPTSSSSSSLSDSDLMLDVPKTAAQQVGETAEKPDTENPLENSQPNALATTTAEAASSPGWRPSGTRCEFLYRDQWHAGVIDSYTSQKAVVKFGPQDAAVSVDLEAEKHRVCWKLGTYTSKSHFA